MQAVAVLSASTLPLPDRQSVSGTESMLVHLIKDCRQLEAECTEVLSAGTDTLESFRELDGQQTLRSHGRLLDPTLKA